MHNPTVRVMEILKLIGATPDLTLTEISEQLQFSKSTILPILKTLVDLHYITQNEDSKTFRIGIETFRISQGFLGANSALDLIKGHMVQIVESCNEICQMGIPDSSDPTSVFYIAKEDPVQAITLLSSIGTSLPAHATALGKCLLSGHTNGEIRKLYAKGLEKLSKNTITDVDTLIAQLEQVRKTNTAYERGETREGIRCVAVPLRQNKRVVAALSVSLPEYRATEEALLFIERTLLSHMKDINTILTGTPLVV